MKKPAWLLATALIVAMSFTACGPKNTDTVSKDDNTPVVSESTEKSSDKITSEDKTSDKNVDKPDSEKTESTESTDVSKKDDTTKSESVSDKKDNKKSDKKSDNFGAFFAISLSSGTLQSNIRNGFVSNLLLQSSHIFSIY